MHRNPLWIAFVLLVFGVTLFFIFKATTSLVAYLPLSERGVGTVERVEVLEKGKNRFLLWAHFSFLVEGKRWEGKGALGPLHLNRYSAEKKAAALSQTTLPLWYNPKKIENVVLEKHFPFKAVLSAGVCTLLTLYFFILGRYVRKNRHLPS